MKSGAWLKHGAEALLALCLAGMVLCVLGNVVLRYGFNSGINATEELSRLLFVWMVFLGATAAYPVGQHMAFTSLVGALRDKPALFASATLVMKAWRNSPLPSTDWNQPNVKPLGGNTAKLASEMDSATTMANGSTMKARISVQRA